MKYEFRTRIEVESYLENIAFGVGGRLWMHAPSNRKFPSNRILSIDLSSRQIKRHYADPDPLCFCGNGEIQIVGTQRGKLQVFLNDNSQQEIDVNLSAPVNCLDVNKQAQSICLATHTRILEISLYGEVTGDWSVHTPPFAIRTGIDGRQVWIVGNGIHVLDKFNGTTKTIRHSQDPWCHLARSERGSIACFGGSIELFAANGDCTTVFDGGFNHGEFVTDTELVVNKTGSSTDELTIEKTIKDEITWNVVSGFNCVAVCESKSLLALSKRRSVFFFQIVDS